MFTLDNLIYDIKNMGIDENTNLFIHSSYKSIGDVEAKTVIDAFIAVVKDSLLMFPTHTWGYIKEDNDVFDKENSPSNVGYLTNVALKMEGFYRSNHPTHSIAAHGKKALEYVKLDDFSSTPTPMSGCMGNLININAKILFLGAPLSKNTFIHACEEEMKVKNRFTDKKYHFITKDKDKKMDYYMYRHFNAQCPHISDNYEKLLPSFLRLGIAIAGKIGNSTCYLLDANKVFKYVCFLIKKDPHIFDDNREIKEDYIKEYLRG